MGSTERKTPLIERGILCKRGHDDWLEARDHPGTFRCRVCRNKLHNRGAVVQATHPQRGGPLGQKCRRGHDDWDVGENLTKRCAACKRDWKRHGGHWSSTNNHGYEGLGKIQWDTMTHSEIMKARGYDAA